MAKFIKIIRNNWKKSVFGTVAVVYGVNYAHEKYKIDQLMRTYCEEAVMYGDVPVSPSLKPRTVTVILNPAANRRKAKSNFEKYCAPLLHLSGFAVNIIQTESEGQARSLAAELKGTDVIVVAGGDGTLSEIITGLMRAHGSVEYPVGVLPLGRTNSVACALLGMEREGEVTPADMALAAMAVVRGQTKAVDTIRVDVVETEEEKSAPKPVYSLSGIKWGTYRDALSKQDKYWYFGFLRGYAAVLFNSLSSQLPVEAHVVYTHACAGCNRCYKSRPDLQPKERYRWYNYLVPSFTKKQPEAQQMDYKRVVNSRCGTVSEMDLTGLDINIYCPCICQGKGVRVSIGPPTLNWSEYLKEGWQRVRGQRPSSITRTLEAQTLQVIPLAGSQSENDGEKWFSIDNEDYEVRPINLTLIPKSVSVFYNKQDHT